MKLRTYSYRFAEAVLDSSEFKALKDEIVDALANADVPTLAPGAVKVRSRKPLKGLTNRRFFVFPVDQKQLNLVLDKAFRDDKGWEYHPLIIAPGSGGPETGLAADFRKGRVQVEVQFGNMARWYSDVFKFQLSYSREVIDVAVLVVPTQAFANMIDENVAYYERVLRELPSAKMSLTLPIWVIGVEPDDWPTIGKAYDDGAAAVVAATKAGGKQEMDLIPFARRVVEQPEEDAPAESGSVAEAVEQSSEGTSSDGDEEAGSS